MVIKIYSMFRKEKWVVWRDRKDGQWDLNGKLIMNSSESWMPYNEGHSLPSRKGKLTKSFQFFLALHPIHSLLMGNYQRSIFF